MDLKPLTYFEYTAAHLYFSDRKLHLILDQTDSGFCITEGEWDTGLRNPIKELNFTKLWKELDSDKKKFYIDLARYSFFKDKEISNR